MVSCISPFVLDEPENIMLMVNDSNVCKGDVITITCSADGRPSVHTYQLFEDDVQVNDSEIDGVWKRTMSAQGNFTYRCVANNTIGTTDKSVTVTVNGNWYFSFTYLHSYKTDRQVTNTIYVTQNLSIQTLIVMYIVHAK